MSHGAKVHGEVPIPVNHKNTGTVLTQVSLTKLFPRYGRTVALLVASLPHFPMSMWKI